MNKTTPMHRRKLWIFMLCCIGCPSFSAAQEDDAPVRLDGPARLAGTGRFLQGKWGLVSVRLANWSDQDRTAQTVSFFDRYRMSQFSGETLVPARAMRTVTLPIYVPDDLDEDATRLDLLTALVEDSGSGEVVQRQSDEDLFPSHFIPITKFTPTSVMITRGDRQDGYAYEAVIAVRTKRKLDRRVGVLADFPLPASPLAYSGTDQLIITDDSLDGDVAAASTIRQWLLDGGHLWVFLESVRQRTLQQLLGNSCRLEYVDRVTLSEVTVAATSDLGASADTRSFEQPVTLVRVLVDGLEVTHTVNGWPAAFQQQVGRGRILFMALDARGWIRPRGPADPEPTDSWMSTNFVPLAPLDDAAGEIMRVSPPPPLSTDDFKPYLYDRIGYQVVDRRPVTAVLLSFCLGLLTAGVWLVRRGRLERFLWIVPSVSVLAVGALGIMGMQARQELPDTASIVQFINLDEQQDELTVRGVAALYQQDKGDATLRGTAGANIQPERFDSEASLRRQVWTSAGPWYWQKLPLDAGLRLAPFQFGISAQPRARLRGTFGPEGFRGRLEPGPFENLSDLLVATPAQFSLALTRQDEEHLFGTPANVQQPGHYISETLLTDEQRRRQDVLRRLLGSSLRQEKYPPQPTLIAWADPLEGGFEFADQTHTIGSALLTLPVQWERPAPGTRVTLPAPFLPYTSVSNAKIGLTTAFDRRSGLWRSTTFAKSALLRFQIPEVVLPLESETATLLLDISAASRTVDVSAGVPDDLMPIAKLEGPLGKTTFKIDDPQALRMDDAGGLHVLISVSQVNFEGSEGVHAGDQQESWLIESLQMELTGRTRAVDSDL